MKKFTTALSAAAMLAALGLASSGPAGAHHRDPFFNAQEAAFLDVLDANRWDYGGDEYWAVSNAYEACTQMYDYSGEFVAVDMARFFAAQLTVASTRFFVITAAHTICPEHLPAGARLVSN